MIVLMLCLFSMLVVYSSVSSLAFKAHGGNALIFFFKHTFFLASGLGIMYVLHKLDFKYFSRIAQVLLWISVPLLIITLIKGDNVNNASRWLIIPIINQSFQTSDLAKLAAIGYTARLLAIKQHDLKSFKNAFIPIMLPVVLVCAFILPANLSTALVVLFSSLMLMFMAGLNWKYLFSLLPIGILFGFLVLQIGAAYPKALPRIDTWNGRVERFLSSDEEEAADQDGNHQSRLAKMAIASGSLWGVGSGNSAHRSILPQASSDFIYAIVVEEYGLIGGLVMLFLDMCLLFRAVKLVQKCETPFASFLVLGLTFSLVFQALINMSVAVNLMPVTGQTLPLISMGGTSVWFTSISLGIILSVSRVVEEEYKKKQEGGILETA